MAAPNIVNVSTISGKTAVQAVSTSATAIVLNSASSGKVYKVNSLLVSNVDGINTAEITIDLYRSSTAYHLIKTASITAGSTLDLLAKTIYLEEGDSIRLTGSAASDLEAVCSYEEIDSTGSGSAGIFSTLAATGNTELGDAEATDTHAIKGATTLLANTSSDALRITQTGSGNALVVEDSANPDSTPFVVDNAGRVGIGTTSPNNALDAIGNIIAYDGGTQATFVASTGYIEISRTNGDAFIDFKTSTSEDFDVRIQQVSNGLRFHTGGDGSASERMRIDSTGNALIGYTSSNGSYKLQVNSQIFATSATIATSDGRYKENITPLDGALNLVTRLNPVQFNWKEHPVHEFDRGQPTVGFIAQEVQEVLKETPYVNSIIKANDCTIEEAVYETIEISPAIPEELDENGEVITPAQEAVTEQRLVSDAVTEEFLGIAEGNLIALLTKALQEANAKIDALETRITELEA